MTGYIFERLGGAFFFTTAATVLFLLFFTPLSIPAADGVGVHRCGTVESPGFTDSHGVRLDLQEESRYPRERHRCAVERHQHRGFAWLLGSAGGVFSLGVLFSGEMITAKAKREKETA